MFKYVYDIRFPVVDHNDPIIKKLKYWSKRAAIAEHDGQKEKVKRAESKLDELIEDLPMDKLNVLSAMYMVVIPNTHAMATGQGAAWAVATRFINESASRILKRRPMFEIV